MATRPVRPHSEMYPPVCCSVSPSVSYSSLTEGPADDGEAQTPIFSVSRSSVDVFKRDPAWSGAAADLRRSASAEQGPPQHFHGRRRVGSLQSPDAHNPPALGERWVSNMRRWSRCSSAHSRSSTPDTVVWGGGTSRPASLARDAACCAVPGSPTTLPSSPFISPLLTPILPLVDHCVTSPLESTGGLLAQQGDSPRSLPASTATSAEEEGFPGNRLLYFQYPSPIATSMCSEEGASPFLGCLPEEKTPPMSEPQGQMSSSVDEEREPGKVASVRHHLQLPWQPQFRKPPLVSSLSDSILCDGCSGGPPMEPFLKEKARHKMVDAAVQTLSPPQTLSPASSWLDLRRNTSHSLLGSPPGSKLDLKASVGSNSNLVSPSSSMFPLSEGEEEDDEKPKDILERRRSCLKAQSGEEKDELGGKRRSSMKQVQWDEDGMTWDVHGASVEPEVLTEAIWKHLEVHNSPQTVKRPSKKKTKAPNPPSAAPPDATPAANGGEATQDGGGETEEAPGEASRAEEGNHDVPKSPSLSRGTIRKRSVMRSLRPGWCGGSKKEDE